VVDVIAELKSYGADVYVHDPIASATEAFREYGLDLISWERLPRAGAIVAAVAHKQFLQRSVEEYVAKLQPGGVFIDVKSQADAVGLRSQGIAVWRL
jgi:UDP-N-acetyl-D-glucosamine/UDP-N-acetyl-D-galactosamine dehydrogenase